MESMFAVFDGEFLFALFPYEEDAREVASSHAAKWGNTDLTVQAVRIPSFEFPARNN